MAASQILKSIFLQGNKEVGTIHFAQTVYSKAFLWGAAQLLTTDAEFCAKSPTKRRCWHCVTLQS